jgi:hypothetical protein
MIVLGLVKIHWWKDRAWITLPFSNPYVQLLAGKKKGVVVELVLDASQCEGEDAKRLHKTVISYRATITQAKRSDGLYWYKAVVPLNISRMLLPVKDCIKAQVFIEPIPFHEKVRGWE